MDLSEEMEEVNRRMENFSLTPSAIPSVSSLSAEPLSPLSPSLMAQRKVMEVCVWQRVECRERGR